MTVLCAFASLFRAMYLCISVNACVVRASVGVSAASRVKSWVWVGAVSVSTTQRAEDHGAACHCTAMFDLQMDSVVVDLQCSCTN